MKVFEKTITLNDISNWDHRNILYILQKIKDFDFWKEGSTIIRCAIIESTKNSLKCELGIVEDYNTPIIRFEPIIKDRLFDFNKRTYVDNSSFNVVLVTPTGNGCEVGGHVDGGAAAILLGNICDNLITHPNQINAADINYQTDNTLYVEGSVLTRFMMGTIGLQPVRSNRLLVIVDKTDNEGINDAVVNAVNAARVCYGLNVVKLIQMDSVMDMRAFMSKSGRAVGEMTRLEDICNIFELDKGNYDAVALACPIHVDKNIKKTYYESDHSKSISVNPWGGVEAMLTHTLSTIYDIPTAHSPMECELNDIIYNPGITDPRVAPEAVSVAYLNCVLKGLMKSPRIITKDYINVPGILTSSNVSAIVIPNGCLGLPTIAAAKQGIPIIVVTGNKSLMDNDLSLLNYNNIYYVNNYIEAAGMLTVLKTGLDPNTLLRPISTIDIEIV